MNLNNCYNYKNYLICDDYDLGICILDSDTKEIIKNSLPDEEYAELIIDNNFEEDKENYFYIDYTIIYGDNSIRYYNEKILAKSKTEAELKLKNKLLNSGIDIKRNLVDVNVKEWSNEMKNNKQKIKEAFEYAGIKNISSKEAYDMDIFYDILINVFGVPSEAIDLVLRINGDNIKTYNDILYVETGYGDLNQIGDDDIGE